jgi:hypothetical protein
MSSRKERAAMILSRKIDLFLRRTGMSATRFGLILARDPNLVREMRAGRQPRAGLRRRIEAMLAGEGA